MSFLNDDEYIIFMAHNEYRAMDSGDPCIVHSVEDRRRMREAGIQTAHEQPAWSVIEPARGQYNWAYLDGLIDRNRQAEMKSLVQISGWRMPKWMPNSWFPRRIDGTVEREVLSLWNSDAQAYLDNYYRVVIDHYKDQKDVRFFFGEFQGGEGIYPATWCLYDELAVADFKRLYGSSSIPLADESNTLQWFDEKCIDHILRTANIFYEAYKEIWNSQQYLMNVWTRAFGNNGHLRAMKRMRELWPDAHIVFLQYTYFDEAHDQDEWQYVDDVINACQCDVFVEAMFAKGLPMTTPRAIAKGFRGQILHPTSSGFSSEPLEGWMVENIRKSNELWSASTK